MPDETPARNDEGIWSCSWRVSTVLNDHSHARQAHPRAPRHYSLYSEVTEPQFWPAPRSAIRRSVAR